MRGGAVTLAEATAEWISRRGAPDLIVATDMLDLASYLGMIRRSAPTVPTAIFMHENQLSYPRQPGEPLDQGLAAITWQSLVAADAIWFNSGFHRRDLLATLPGYLADTVDRSHSHLLAAVEAKCRVVPVGVDVVGIRSAGGERAPDPAGPLVLANHRWHHDKDVGAILRALIRIADEGTAFRLAVVGDQTGGQADELMPLIERLGRRVVAVGHQPRADYLKLLRRSDIVVSAARNEFFGISVIEAAAAGAVPVLPRALAYPEVVPVRYHDSVLYDPGDLTDHLRSTIRNLDSVRAATGGLAESMERFDWRVVAETHDEAASVLVDASAVGSPG